MKNIMTFILSALSAFPLFAQQAPEVQWQKVYGGSGSEKAKAIRQTADGGYIVVGTTSSSNGDVSNNQGGGDCWLVKLDPGGIISWQKTLGGTGNECAYDVQQTFDGGYIVAGFTESDDGDVSGSHGSLGDFWVVKTDMTGNIEWQRTLGSFEEEIAYAVRQTPDSGYVVAGHSKIGHPDGDVSNPVISGSGDIWLVKLDIQGNLLWDKSVGGLGNDYSYGMTINTDESIVIAGTTYSDELPGYHGNGDFLIVKMDAAGIIQWQKCLGGSQWDDAHAIQSTVDGGYVVVGGSWSADGNITGNHGMNDYWVVKLDSLGNIEWEKSIGGSAAETYDYWEQLADICITPDSGYILALFAESTDGDFESSPGYTAWLLKLGGMGNLQWKKAVNQGSIHGFSIQSTVDTGYIVAGSIWYNSSNIENHHGEFDFYAVKLKFNPDSNTTNPVSVNRVGNPLLNATIFPNPAKKFFSVTNMPPGATVEVINATGNVIMRQEKTQPKDLIDIDKLNDGAYFVKIYYKNHYCYKKLVKAN